MKVTIDITADGQVMAVAVCANCREANGTHFNCPDIAKPFIPLLKIRQQIPVTFVLDVVGSYLCPDCMDKVERLTEQAVASILSQAMPGHERLN